MLIFVCFNLVLWLFHSVTPATVRNSEYIFLCGTQFCRAISYFSSIIYYPRRGIIFCLVLYMKQTYTANPDYSLYVFHFCRNLLRWQRMKRGLIINSQHNDVPYFVLCSFPSNYQQLPYCLALHECLQRTAQKHHNNFLIQWQKTESPLLCLLVLSGSFSPCELPCLLPPEFIFQFPVLWDPSAILCGWV